MDLKALAASLIGSVNNAPNYGANVLDTPTNTAELGNIRNMVGLTGKGTAAQRATGALGAASSEKAAAEEAAKKAAAQKAQDEAERAQKEMERLEDPKNYLAQINDAGGYDFYDPMGNKISAVEYARKKNMHVTDVYKDSKDANDKDFVDDYKRVNELGKIFQSGDKKARDKFFEKNPDFKEAYGNSTYDEIVKDFRSEYPGYFRSDKELENDRIKNKRAPQGEVEDKKKNSGGFLGRILKGLLGG